MITSGDIGKAEEEHPVLLLYAKRRFPEDTSDTKRRDKLRNWIRNIQKKN